MVLACSLIGLIAVTVLAGGRWWRERSLFVRWLSVDVQGEEVEEGLCGAGRR